VKGKTTAKKLAAPVGAALTSALVGYAVRKVPELIGGGSGQAQDGNQGGRRQPSSAAERERARTARAGRRRERAKAT
jgi:hypothetical protein